MSLFSALASGPALAQEAPRAPVPPAAVSDAPPPTPSSEPPPSEPQFVLPTVKVEGEASPYNVQDSGLVRSPKPLVDTPQSVVVIPEAVIEQQRAGTIRDALRNVSGITVSVGEGGRQGDTFILRGFSAQTDLFRDGMRDLGWFTRDTFNIQSVEVYFGPSAVLFGRGSTGGAINLITKKPTDTTAGSVTLQGGTAPSGRLEGDVSVALSDAFQLRLEAMGQLAQVPERDQASANRAGFSPTLRWRLAERTTLDLDYFYQHEHSTPDYGHPYYAPAPGKDGYPVSYNIGVPRNAWYGVTGDNLPDLENVNVNVATVRLQHGFSDQTSLTTSVRYGQVHRLARPTAPRGLTPAVDPTTIGRQRYEIQTDNDYLAVQLDLRTQFRTGILEHTLTSGGDVSYEERSQYRRNSTIPPGSFGTPVNLPADLYHPDPSPDLSQVAWGYASNNDTTQKVGGVYVSDQIAITRYVEVLGSVRYDIFDTHVLTNSVTAPSGDQTKNDGFFNWRAGLVLHPFEKTSLYGMYGTSANPSAEFGVFPSGTVTLDPEENAIAEVGAKADLFDDRLSLTGSLFRIDKKNARVPDPDGSGQMVLAGKQRVDGYALGIVGTLIGSWRVLANYTFLDSNITDNPNPVLVGQPLPSTPKRSLSAWTTFQPFRGFTLGGGAVYADAASVNNPTFAGTTASNLSFYKVPAYWRFDAFASYAWKALELQVNVYNIGNALYYEQYYSSHAAPAAGRSASLTATVRF
jgi:catecholate siderophore receptor